MLTEQDLRDFGYVVTKVQYVDADFSCLLEGGSLGDTTASVWSTEQCLQVALRIGLESDVPEAERYPLVVQFMDFNAMRTLTRVDSLPVKADDGAVLRRHFLVELTIDLRSAPTKEQFDTMVAQAVEDRFDAYEMFEASRSTFQNAG